MGDIRFEAHLKRVAQAPDRAAAIRSLTDEEVVAALAATADRASGYLANVLASEAMNRIRRKSTIVDTAPEGMCELDDEGHVISMNPAAEQMLGWREEELRGRRLHDIVHGGLEGDLSREAAHCPFDAATSAGAVEAATRDDLFASRAGPPLAVAYTVTPVRRDGETQGSVVVFRDVSERKRRERLARLDHEVVEAIATASGLADVARDVLKAIATSLRHEAAALWTRTDGIEEMRCATFWSVADAPAAELSIECLAGVVRPGEGPAGEAWAAARIVGASVPGAGPGEGYRARLIVPCASSDRVLGLLDLYSVADREIGADERDALLGVASRLAQFLARSRAEAERAESVALMDGILRAALDAIVTIDHEGRVIGFNPAAEAIFGFTEAEALGHDLYGLIVPPRFREAHRAGMRRYLATGEARVLNRILELPAVHKDGTEFPTELYIVRVPGSDPPVFTSHIRDIRERKRTEAALRAAEKQYRGLFLSAPDAIVLADVERRILDVNPAFTRVLGYEPEDLRGQPSAVLYASENDHAAIGQQARGLAGDDAFVANATLRRRSGETFSAEVHGAVLRGEADVPTGFVGIIRDLTEQEEMLEEKSRAAAALAAAQEQLPVVAFMVAADGAIVHANERALQALGYTAAELVGRPLESLCVSADRPVLQAQLHAALARPGEVLQASLRKLTKDGRRLWMIEELRAARHPMRGGAPAIFVACADVTALVQMRLVAEALVPPVPPGAVASRVASAFREAFDVDAVDVFLAESGGLRPVATAGPRGESLALASRATAEGAPTVVVDEPARAVVLALRTEDALVGALVLRVGAPRVWSAAERGVLDHAAARVARVLGA